MSDRNPAETQPHPRRSLVLVAVAFLAILTPPSLARASDDASKTMASKFRIVFDPATGQLRYQTTEETTEQRTVDCDAKPSTYRAFPIYFELDKDVLKKDEKTHETLAGIRDFLVDNPKTEVRIEGHTDTRASDDYNVQLSQRRAVRVMAWLVDHGVGEDRLTSEGKGEHSPNYRQSADDKAGVEKADFEACSTRKNGAFPEFCEARVWSKTRRVEVWVTKGTEALTQKCKSTSKRLRETTYTPLAEAACPYLLGPRLGALGPNSWVNAGASLQPAGLCWLELTATAGLMVNTVDLGDGFSNQNVEVPLVLRGRFWFGGHHAFVPELGLGITPYASDAGLTAEVLGHLGVGYGYRFSRAEGWRLGASVGMVVQSGAYLLAPLAVQFEQGFELAPYGELWGTYMFDMSGGG